MAGFTADAALAAMSQRAAQLLKTRQQALTPAGSLASVPQAAPAQIPSTFLQNRVNQLGGLARMSASVVNQLRSYGGYGGSYQTPQALTDALNNDAAGGNDISDFVRGLHMPSGMSDEDYRAYVQGYAPSYGGVTFNAHNIAQEGDISYRNGVPGRMIKFTSPGQGSSTEWVPDPGSGGGGGGGADPWAAMNALLNNYRG